jgi:hypothetical protein
LALLADDQDARQLPWVKGPRRFSEGLFAALAKSHGGFLAALDEESEVLLSFPTKHSASDDASSGFAAFAGSLTAASRSPIIFIAGWNGNSPPHCR